MDTIDARDFIADRAWGSRLLLDFGPYSARLHWTDQPYRWHENSGDELFVVLDGEVEMHHADAQGGGMQVLAAGQMVVVREGERHLAVPRGAARLLVIERKDSA